MMFKTIENALNQSRPDCMALPDTSDDDLECFAELSKLDIQRSRLSSFDMTFWSAYPWLNFKGFRFILAFVVLKSVEENYFCAEIINLIVSDCSGCGLNPNTENRSLWVDPFAERWCSLGSEFLSEIETWLGMLLESECGFEDAEIEECLITLAWLMKNCPRSSIQL